MPRKRKNIYDEQTIKTLHSLEHIRLRPGMYIGRIGDGSNSDDGIYILLKEVIDNAVDEFIMGFGKKIKLTIHPNCARVRDYGRGIPLGKLFDCVSKINTGAKFNTDVFQFSVGLNGVGLKAVNAMSQDFEVTSFRNQTFRKLFFQDGCLTKEEKGSVDLPDGTEITFTPSTALFGKFSFQDIFIRLRLWNYAYLNSGLSLWYQKDKIYAKQGLQDLINSKVEEDTLYPVIHHQEDKLEFSFCHTSNYGETYYSFVNGQLTNDGGTHQSAFREGILKGIREFAKKNFHGDDVRNGIVGSVSIRLQAPIFESQTKNRLSNVEIRSELVQKIKVAVADYLHKHADTTEKILDKISRNEKIRREIQEVKKVSREKARKFSLKLPRLKDCKFHLHSDGDKGAHSMIFLTEGESAAGSMIHCRDVYTQAIFALRGKPPNCYGKKRDLLVSNNEFYCMMRALNIENNLDNLRYEKVIIATDADDDGMHIRNLLLTFFLYYFEQLILSEHLFILETPLFRVRNRQRTRYCYNESERDGAVEELAGKIEITRFKGLGEISPHEFKPFIGDKMRLTPVNIDSMHQVPKILKFFMGKNTPERRNYIMKNLL